MQHPCSPEICRECRYTQYTPAIIPSQQAHHFKLTTTEIKMSGRIIAGLPQGHMLTRGARVHINTTHRCSKSNVPSTRDRGYDLQPPLCLALKRHTGLLPRDTLGYSQPDNTSHTRMRKTAAERDHTLRHEAAFVTSCSALL